MITWFAGLFYIPRLFIYFIDATKKSSTERNILTNQFSLMMNRLWYIITWPSSILALIFGFWLLILVPQWLYQNWMIAKLFFVLALVIYHLKTHFILKELQQGIVNYSSDFMRIWNEGATLLLFAIVFLVILKDSFHWVFGLFGILGLGVILVLGIRLYKKIRIGK